MLKSLTLLVIVYAASAARNNTFAGSLTQYRDCDSWSSGDCASAGDTTILSKSAEVSVSTIPGHSEGDLLILADTTLILDDVVFVLGDTMTHTPTKYPTAAPTSSPTSAPTAAPTHAPTPAPTAAPTLSDSGLHEKQVKTLAIKGHMTDADTDVEVCGG
jgi:hypothetical protein